MIDSPQLQRLTKADPARGLDPTAPDELLARLVACPRRPAPPVRARRRALGPAIGIAAVLALVGVAALIGTPGGPRAVDLAAQAYAQTGPDTGQIVHVIASTERSEITATATTSDLGSIEEWHRGSETHRRERFTKGGTPVTVDHLITADGTLREATPDGGSRVVPPSAGGYSAAEIAGQQQGFVGEFRQRYEQGELAAAGDVQFAGTPARRYVVTLPDGAGDGGLAEAFYVDRETGEPLGYTSTWRGELRDLQGGSVPTTVRFTETVRLLERLEPTPQNLRELGSFTS
jgi:hypothetical protein